MVGAGPSFIISISIKIPSLSIWYGFVRGFLIWSRNVIFTKKFNISLLISVVGLVPVLIWNIDNNFESFAFHGNRSSFVFDFQHIFKSVFAQLFFLLPTTGFFNFFNSEKQTDH